MSLDEIFGVACLPYRTGWRQCVENAWVLPMDNSPDPPTFGGGAAKTVWETGDGLTFRATTIQTGV